MTIAEILKKYRRVAVIGVSPKEVRPSHWITEYLIEQGFDVIGVNPAQTKIKNFPMVRTLFEVPDPLEIVNVFRSPDAIPELVEELAARNPKVLWLQPGAQNPTAEKRARELGMIVISGPCIYQEHAKVSR